MTTKFEQIYDNLQKLNLQYSNLCQNLRFQQSLPIIEQIVQILKNTENVEPKIFEQAYIKLAQNLNAVAMISLQNNQIETCFKYLKRAQSIGIQNIKIQSTTFNNLGCYYRKVKKYSTSLIYLKKSLELQLKLANPINLPDTYINICAVLSSLDEHEYAISHAMMSIILLQHQIMGELMQRFKAQIQKQNIVKSEKLSILSLAHYNLGVEFEHLNKMEEATRFYDKAIFITQQYNSKNIRLLTNLQKVKLKIESDIKQKMAEGRKTKRKIQNLKTQYEKDSFYKNLQEKIKKDSSPSNAFKSGQESRLHKYSPGSTKKMSRENNSIKQQPLLLSAKRDRGFKINHHKYKIKEFFV